MMLFSFVLIFKVFKWKYKENLKMKHKCFAKIKITLTLQIGNVDTSFYLS